MTPGHVDGIAVKPAPNDGQRVGIDRGWRTAVTPLGEGRPRAEGRPTKGAVVDEDVLRRKIEECRALAIELRDGAQGLDDAAGRWAAIMASGATPASESQG